MFKVELTNSAELFLLENVTREETLARIEGSVRMLAEFPLAGPEYRPDYPAATPPFPCRYLPLPGTPFTLYYLVDETRSLVQVIDIEWTAGDPRRRFRSA